MIDASFLALKITYLMKQSGKNRFTISEAKIKRLAQKEVLTISYLCELKRNLEELGIFLGTLKKGAFCLLLIESLEGAPSLPLKEVTLTALEQLSEAELMEHTRPAIFEPIADNVQDEEMLLLNKLWLLLTQTASNKEVISYGALAKKLESNPKCKVHHKKVIVLLESIKQFCREGNQCPLLVYLAVNDKTRLPTALESVSEAKNKLEEEKAKIYNFSWDNQKENFDLFLKQLKEN